MRFLAAKLAICVDYNHLDITDIMLNLTQVVDFPTHEETTLDVIVTDLSQQYEYSPPQPLPHMG